MKFWNFLVATAVALFAVSCNDDDDLDNDDGGSDQTEAGLDIVDALAGTYEGYTSASFTYVTDPMITSDESFTLTANDDGTTLTLSYVSETWGTFTFSSVSATLSDGVYTIEGEGSTVMGMSSDSSSEYDATVSGTISEDKSDFAVTFTVPSVMGGLTVTFYSGDAPGDEGDEGTAESVVEAVVGSYSGMMSMTVSGSSQGEFEVEVTFAAADDGTLTISVPSMSMGSSMTLPAFDITGVAVSESESGDGTYTITLESATIETESMTVKVADLTGTVYAVGSAEFTMNVTPGAMPMSITFAFSSVE